MWGPPDSPEDEEYVIPTRILWFSPECRSEVTDEEISALRDEGIIAIFTSFRPEFVGDAVLPVPPSTPIKTSILRLLNTTSPDEKG